MFSSIPQTQLSLIISNDNKTRRTKGCVSGSGWKRELSKILFVYILRRSLPTYDHHPLQFMEYSTIRMYQLSKS